MGMGGMLKRTELTRRKQRKRSSLPHMKSLKNLFASMRVFKRNKTHFTRIPYSNHQTDKRCNQTFENCKSLTSDDHFRDFDGALVEKVLSYNFPSHFLKRTTIQQLYPKIKSIASSESVVEGIQLPYDQSQESNSFCYLSEKAFGRSESYANVQGVPSSEFFYNSFPYKNTDNYNTIQDSNFEFQNNLYCSNPCDIILDLKPSRNKCNFEEISPSTDSRISENGNKYLGNNFLYMNSNHSSLVDDEIINLFGDKKLCIVESNMFIQEKPSFQSKDKEIFNCEKYSHMSYDEVNLSEHKHFHVEDILKRVEHSDNWLKNGFITEKDLYKDKFKNSAKVFFLYIF
ncbi:zinc finger protein 98 [Trichonephila clavata]|uniref:Zinc finger protein 98 n=1 Tax=Trichonephila clavata TaxID=2740835 RepID=A0A8X6ILP8_TRICU|nr:zinc finger protein 98 [Trichonephila clavata]